MIHIKQLISFFFLLFLITISTLLWIKNPDGWYLIFGIFTLLPLVISLLFGFFKRKLLHPVFWTTSTLLIIFFICIKLIRPKFDNHFFEENYIAVNYFDKKVGLLTPFEEITAFNSDVDSCCKSDRVIIKCLYRIGFKKNPNNYYIGKVEIKDGKILREIYNKKVLDDRVFTKKEFGEALLKIRELRAVIDAVNKNEKQIEVP